MAGEQRALVKAAKRAGLREGPKPVGDRVALIDGEGRVVWQGVCTNPANLRDAKRDLRARGFDVR